MQERFIPMYLTATFDSATGDNFTKYPCLASHFLVSERAVEQPPFSMGLMQKPSFLSKTLTNPALQVAHINANQVSISCTDVESPMHPCQSEPVVLHAELPQGVSTEWLYLAQCWRTKENTGLQWSMQISELHLLKVVAEWNRRNSYLDFFSSAVSGFEAEREVKYSQLLFSVGVNCRGTWKDNMACYLSYTPGSIHRFLWSWYYELSAAQAELTLPVPNNLPLFD